MTDQQIPMTVTPEHEVCMRRCLQLAAEAFDNGEVPVGALITFNGEIIAEATNQPISACDPTAHAEICAIRMASKVMSNYRLVGCTLYSTIEPCLMCAGACMHARLDRVVFGAPEPRAGAASGEVNYFSKLQHLHKTEVVGGILAFDCREIIQRFFRQRR